MQMIPDASGKGACLLRYLVAFYSRTGATKRVAEKLAQLLTSDVEEIFDTTNRMGFFNWLRSGRDADTKRLTVIRKTEKIPHLTMW
jgi:flavodoxin